MSHTPDASWLIQVNDLVHHYHQQPLLTIPELRIDAGQYISIIGLNGVGKSTLLRLLLNLLPMQQGHIQHQVGLRIGYVPQRWQVNPLLPISVADFLALSWNKQTAPFSMTQQLEQWQLAPIAHQNIHTLSGGQWQRLLLANALLNQPQLLALDEPTQGLDLHSQHEFYRQIQQLHQQGVTILMISHDLAHAMSYSQRVIALADGGICCDGAPQHLLQQPHYQQRFVCAHQDAIAPHHHCEHSHA